MTGIIYRYRDFNIEINLSPQRTAFPPHPTDGEPGHTALPRYACEVRLSGRAGQSDLPSLAVLDNCNRLFTDEQDAVIAGCCAAEAAINSAIAIQHGNAVRTAGRNRARVCA
jgi:hypothetical protein